MVKENDVGNMEVSTDKWLTAVVGGEWAAFIGCLCNQIKRFVVGFGLVIRTEQCLVPVQVHDDQDPGKYGKTMTFCYSIQPAVKVTD